MYSNILKHERETKKQEKQEKKSFKPKETFAISP